MGGGRLVRIRFYSLTQPSLTWAWLSLAIQSLEWIASKKIKVKIIYGKNVDPIIHFCLRLHFLRPMKFQILEKSTKKKFGSKILNKKICGPKIPGAVTILVKRIGFNRIFGANFCMSKQTSLGQQKF